jgi:hypothetical protein
VCWRLEARGPEGLKVHDHSHSIHSVLTCARRHEPQPCMFHTFTLLPCLAFLPSYESSSEDSSTAENFSDNDSTENEAPEPEARVPSVAKTSRQECQLSRESQHVPTAEGASGSNLEEEEIRSVSWVGQSQHREQVNLCLTFHHASAHISPAQHSLNSCRSFYSFWASQVLEALIKATRLLELVFRGQSLFFPVTFFGTFVPSYLCLLYFFPSENSA